MENLLAELRTNIFYEKNDKGEFVKINELIFISSTPKYSLNNEKQVVRSRELLETRICIKNKDLDQLLVLLLQIKDSEEKDLI